ncbi:arginine deiminase family protein [Streptomyces albiaxialis]|uniref:arginine deiminase family protein n=1 Tax=Streptomyces albiaxialis TaxID=329523 RepID=UPI003CD06F73
MSSPHLPHTGSHVIEIVGDELVKGRGGPRCMSTQRTTGSLRPGSAHMGGAAGDGRTAHGRRRQRSGGP